MSKKKILSLVLCLVMVLSLLPVTSLAAQYEIKTVTIKGVKSPVAREEIPEFTCSGGVAKGSNGYTISAKESQVNIVKAFWGTAGSTNHPNTNYKTMPTYGNSDEAGNEFQSGQSYYLWLLLFAEENSDYRFDSSNKVTTIKTEGSVDRMPEFILQAGQKEKYIHDNQVNFVHPQNLEFDHGWSNGGTGSYTWVKLYYPCYTYLTDGANDKYPNSTWATANASWPELGKSPNFTVETAEPKVYTASDVKWYPTGKPSNTMSASDKFLAGLGYTLEFKLNTVDPYASFLSPLIVDGPTYDGKLLKQSSSSVTCTFDFPVLDDVVTKVNLTGIQAPVAGQPKQTKGVTATDNQCQVSSISVSGNFDSSGNYKAGETYTMTVNLMPKDGYTFKTLTKSMVTVDYGTVKDAGIREVGQDVKIELKAGGEQEKIDKGNVSFDLTNGTYVVPDMSMADSDILSETINWLAGENKIKVVSDGYQLNGSGVTDVVVQSSAGTTTMKQGDSSKQAGSVVLSLSQSTIDSKVPAGGAYYSSVTFKFPGTALQDLGTLNLNLTSGSATVAETNNAKAFEATVKVVSQLTYKNGDPASLDLDKDGTSDVLLSWSGGGIIVEPAAGRSASGEYTVNIDKTAVMTLTDQGAPAYYSTIYFKLAPLEGGPTVVPSDTIDLTTGSESRPVENFYAAANTLLAAGETGLITVTDKGSDIYAYDLDKNGTDDMTVTVTTDGKTTNVTLLASNSMTGDKVITISAAGITYLNSISAPAYCEELTIKFPEGGVEPGGFDPTGLVNPFKDVAESDYFYVPVLWAYYTTPQVTVGISATRFGPDSTVTRGQCVTFLWRAMGEPEPTTTTNPFVDVKESDYYYKAVLWAVEKNITVGVNATHFVPSQTCSTAHIITFLYRTLGIGSNGWYEEAGDWAAKDHLLDDTGLTVSPKVDCPRAAVVTFLYRELA